MSKKCEAKCPLQFLIIFATGSLTLSPTPQRTSYGYPYWRSAKFNSPTNRRWQKLPSPFMIPHSIVEFNTRSRSPLFGDFNGHCSIGSEKQFPSRRPSAEFVSTHFEYCKKRSGNVGAFRGWLLGRVGSRGERNEQILEGSA